MNSKKKLFMVLVFILLDTVLLLCFLFFRRLTFVNILKQEVNEMSKLDITKDRYNRKLRTRGSYRVVESAIKEYLDDYALKLQETSSLVSDSKFTNILSYENVEKDGPNFEESLMYLDDFSKSYNNKIEYLLDHLNEDTIKNYVNSRISSTYYRNLYQELMLHNEIWDDLFQTKELVMNSRNYVNHYSDSCISVFQFLKEKQGSWSLENGEIKFQNQEDLDYYNNMLSFINKNK